MAQEFKILDPYDNELHTYLWKPKGRKKPIGVVQLIHGAGEHTGRYDHFAQYLVGLGLIVIGHDHLGHGKTAETNEYVHFADDMGFHKLYGGIQIVRDYIEENFSGLPVVMIAHSMGSFIGRYAILHDYKRYDLACFTGTGWFSPLSITSGALASKALIKTKGKRFVSDAFTKFTDQAVKSMKKNGLINKRIEWLTHDRKIQDEFLQDELCGKPFTVGAQSDLFEVLKEIQNKKRIKESASSTAIYFISGEYDALGDYGIAIKKMHKFYLECGYSNVQYSIVNGARHEVLNELDREQTYERIGTWITNNI